MGKPPRRRQEERSAKTRARLRAATEKTLLSHGYARASTVEICRCAGVSRGAMLHHYPTKKDLIIDTARHRFERAREEVENLAAAFGRGDLSVAEFIEGMWSEVFPKRAVILTVETLVASRSDPELEDTISEFLAKMFSGYEAVSARAFAGAGLSAEQRHVLVLLAACAVRGLRYQQLMNNNPVMIGAIKRALRHTIETVLAAGPEGLGKAINAKRGPRRWGTALVPAVNKVRSRSYSKTSARAR